MTQAETSTPTEPTHGQVRWLFLRALALVYLCAFLSLAVQVEGLIGSRGILPAEELLGHVRGRTSAERFWLLPTVFWLDAGDRALVLACGGGAALAVALLSGLAPVPVLALLWALYLSFLGVGQVFLGYQWDALLLETGLLAVFLAPGGVRPRAGGDVPRAPLWLLRWLLFRLMFGSGLVKLASGDPTWRTLTALDYHYWTQPLPTRLGWFAHQLPSWFQWASVAVMFAVELLVPLLVFAGRRARLAAFFPLAVLQLLIAATGNYAFFNLLTLALCLTLLDDAALPRALQERLPVAGKGGHDRRLRPQDVALAVVVVPLSLIQLLGATRLTLPWPEPLVALYRAAAPLESVNGYGLFAVMTTSRREIVLEGSRDGANWSAYEFRFKPGDVRRAPGFVAPHQPRLDWQMWFAALGPCEASPWLMRLMQRLRQGSPEVVALLANDPFPGAPPRQVRAALYDYRFSDPAALRREGVYWRRERLGLFCPTLGESLPDR